MKYVVVKFPNEGEKSPEYKTYREALTAFIDCIEQASLTKEIATEAQEIIMEEDTLEEEAIVETREKPPNHRKEQPTIPIMEYFIGNQIISLYRKQ